MTYTAADLREQVRDLIQNVDESQMTDAALDTICTLSRMRLDKDHPNDVTALLTGTGGKYYSLEALSEWIHEFSAIRYIINPTPVVANNDDINFTEQKLYKVIEIGGVEYLWIDENIASGETATIKFTTRWKVQDLDGAVASTITNQWWSALVYACVAGVCDALANKSAGVMDKQIPGDMINWQSKDDSYRRQAREWNAKYLAEVGLDKDHQKAIIVRADYDPALQHGRPYMTHFPRFR